MCDSVTWKRRSSPELLRVYGDLRRNADDGPLGVKILQQGLGSLRGAIGTPGPPVILYAAAQDWSPRTVKANIQAFLMVNQAVILIGYWWAGLLDREVWRLTWLFAAPAVVGLAAGMLLFNRLDRARFRRGVFAVLFVSGLVLLIRG